jgi:hypothetical protein
VVARALIACNSSGLYVFSLSCVITTLTAAATKTKPIGNDDDCQFMIIINGASTVAPIGLLLKMAKFCHTSNRSLLGRQCRHALLRLYFNSSATGRWSVGNKGCQALGRSLQKDNIMIVCQNMMLLATQTICLKDTHTNSQINLGISI